jgi:hypothetical protein
LQRRLIQTSQPTVLSRVQAFLPQLKASNEILAQKLQTDAKSLDIESIEENATQVIEMVFRKRL